MRETGIGARALGLHLGVIALLFALQFMLPAYHQGMVARIMVLATYAIGYNLLFGYTGLLSLGHAMFFAAGLYGAGLAVDHLGWGMAPAFLAGIAAGMVLSLVVGLLALRTSGVAFMIVTMMFSQVFYLLIIYFADYTHGNDGFSLPPAARRMAIGGMDIVATDPVTRYFLALALLGIMLLVTLALVRSSFGRVLVAIRENEERTKMLGYDTFRTKLSALVLSGGICAAAGAAYVLLFGYAGASFAAVPYSILPLLWVLLGGAATTLGPFLGTVIMFYAVDYLSGVTAAYMLLVGAMLILLVLFFPRGILGTVRQRWLRWLP
jgi:branched-chain amino acid transport system permease protein